VPLLVKSDEFRPIKIDGNPEHPYNQGAADPSRRRRLLDFYDPDRSQHVTYRRENRRMGGSLRRSCERRWPRAGTEAEFTSSLQTHYFAHTGAAVESGGRRPGQLKAHAVRPCHRRNCGGRG